MADIRQAALWMRDGKQVLRHQWRGDHQSIHPTARPTVKFYAYQTKDGRVRWNMVPNGPLPMETQDLLADDWELAEPDGEGVDGYDPIRFVEGLKPVEGSK
jgi:hypothetical protein